MKRPLACAMLFALALTAAPGLAAPPTIGQPAPEITGAGWINSPPLTLAALRGRVVLIDFWTYG